MDISALFDLSYGLYVLSASDKGRPTGCIINTAMQVTSYPEEIAVCVNRDNYTNGCIKEGGRFTISILSEEADNDIIGRFGFRSGKDTDKYSELAYGVTAKGNPYLNSKVCGYIECEVIGSMELNTHTMFVGKVIGAERFGGAPMTYAYYHAVLKGKAPKNAPTYRAEAVETAPAEAWVCSVCGYVYDSDDPAFADLPENWVCPICGVAKNNFKRK